MKKIITTILGLSLMSVVVFDSAAISDEASLDERLKKFELLPLNEQQRIREEAEQFRKLTEEEKKALCRKFKEEHGYLPPRCR